jgi:hypothetical protein
LETSSSYGLAITWNLTTIPLHPHHPFRIRPSTGPTYKE